MKKCIDMGRHGKLNFSGFSNAESQDVGGHLLAALDIPAASVPPL